MALCTHRNIWYNSNMDGDNGYEKWPSAPNVNNNIPSWLSES